MRDVSSCFLFGLAKLVVEGRGKYFTLILTLASKLPYQVVNLYHRQNRVQGTVGVQVAVRRSLVHVRSSKKEGSRLWNVPEQIISPVRGHLAVAKIILFLATVGSVGTATYERMMGLVCAIWNNATLNFDVISNRG